MVIDLLGLLWFALVCFGLNTAESQKFWEIPALGVGVSIRTQESVMLELSPQVDHSEKMYGVCAMVQKYYSLLTYRYRHHKLTVLWDQRHYAITPFLDSISLCFSLCVWRSTLQFSCKTSVCFPHPVN
jgi:hypothetical protein